MYQTNTETQTTQDHDATYSPEDNKIRIYPAYRLDREDYDRLKKAGFKWAAKQRLFVAPMWTPHREDIAVEFCGEINDEDTSLVDRTEFRADRFKEYSHKRANEAEAERDHVKTLADQIPFGQPILVGHHSEKRARKHAQKIENGMRRAVNLWETSKYWKMRAAGAIRHAEYKERPDVRARRIKKLEADQRRFQRNIDDAKKWLNVWLHPSIFAKSRADLVANYSQNYDLWSKLDKGEINHKEARSQDVPRFEASIKFNTRWVNHFKNRLIYEKAMLEDQGASDLLKPKKRPKQLPLCNYRAKNGIEIENIYRKGEMIHHDQVKMTKEEYKNIPNDSKGTRGVENSHRVRVAMVRTEKGLSNVCVYLTDSKTHKKPEAKEALAPRRPKLVPKRIQPAEKTEFDDMKESLNKGIQVVSAPQLFETPQELAEKMVDLAEIKPGQTVLEPNAGTGRLIAPIVESVDTEVLAYEINQNFCSGLESKFPSYRVRVKRADFLEVTDHQGRYPKIIMNPPFENGSDIKHIKHAIKFLAPGGRLVALCANGPRQQRELKPLAENSGGFWEDLPAGTFKNAGTMVNTALLVYKRGL